MLGSEQIFAFFTPSGGCKPAWSSWPGRPSTCTIGTVPARRPQGPGSAHRADPNPADAWRRARQSQQRRLDNSRGITAEEAMANLCHFHRQDEDWLAAEQDFIASRQAAKRSRPQQPTYRRRPARGGRDGRRLAGRLASGDRRRQEGAGQARRGRRPALPGPVAIHPRIMGGLAPGPGTRTGGSRSPTPTLPTPAARPQAPLAGLAQQVFAVRPAVSRLATSSRSARLNTAPGGHRSGDWDGVIWSKAD